MPVLLLPHFYEYLLFMSICVHFAILNPKSKHGAVIIYLQQDKNIPSTKAGQNTQHMFAIITLNLWLD